MKIINTLNQNQIEQLYYLYKNEWWCKDRTVEETKKVVQNSTLIFAVIDNGRLVAFARVLSDFIFKALIFDVIVDKNYRGKGYGRLIIEEILKSKELKDVKSFELYCLEEMRSFYSKLGFREYKDLKLLGLKR